MKIHKEIQKVYKQLVLEKLMFLCKFSVEFALQHNIWGGESSNITFIWLQNPCSINWTIVPGLFSCGDKQLDWHLSAFKFYYLGTDSIHIRPFSDYCLASVYKYLLGESYWPCQQNNLVSLAFLFLSVNWHLACKYHSPVSLLTQESVPHQKQLTLPSREYMKNRRWGLRDLLAAASFWEHHSQLSAHLHTLTGSPNCTRYLWNLILPS